MVEYAASGRDHHGRQAGARICAALRADDAGLSAAVRHPVDDPHPHRHPGAPRPGPDAGGAVMNFDMGAYGAYIWPAYAISAAALIGVTVWTLAAYARAKAKLKALERK